jgi:hypothetical protein
MKCTVPMFIYKYSKNYLFKGTVSRDFLLLVFFMNQFPPSPRVFHLERFEFFRKFAEIFACQGASPVSTTPVANFSSIFASVVDTGGKFATGVVDTIIATISGCRHLKVNLKAKIYIYVNSTTQRCPNKIIKIFLLEVFSICHRCR